jgi:predicted ATP-grasp superfamily ATP-dependent carboligase
MVVPADYESTLLLARTRGLACRARICAMPEATTLRRLNDKWQFTCLLDRLGLPCPRSELVVSPEALAGTRLGFPIVTKPTNRWAGVGFQIHRTAAELARTLTEGRLAAAFPLLAQRYVRGVDVGFGFLAKRGRLVACTAFEHTFRGRRHFDAPSLRSFVEVLIEESGYHGVGEVDARVDPRTGEYRLFELNPRFWASLLHTANGGLNFPELLVHLDQLGDGPPFTARTGEARLQAYESAVRKATQISQRLHDVGYRLLPA